MNDVTKPIPSSSQEPSRVTRPRGSFSQYAFNQDCTVSLMTVLPGQRLSLQSRTQRAELWIVLEKSACVQAGVHVHDGKPGDDFRIPANEKHRLSCTGGTSCRVLEAALGNWQQQDIIRDEDDFHRPTPGE